MEEWVVTFRIAEKGSRNWGLAEFFRGTEEECRRIEAGFVDGECDILVTAPWQIVVGPAEAWHEFLRQFENVEE
jgi:hypothetical protein